MITVDESAPRPRRRPVKAILTVLVVVVIAYVIAAPYITLYQLKSAVTDKDVDAMSDLVDFPRVRESLKAQFTASLIKSAQQQQQQGNNFAGLGEGLGMMMAGPMIDAMITPANVIGMMSSGQMPDPKSDVAPSSGGQNAATASMHYTGINRFAFDIEQPGSGNRLRMLLCREGFGWRLCDVRLPGS